MTVAESKQVNKLNRESERREREALVVYRPSPQQLPIHRCCAKEILCRGGKRCLGGEQEIYDPVSGISRRIDSIDSEFHVWSLNPNTGGLEIKSACKPFIKGHGELYRIHFASGFEMTTTLEHRLIASDGTWISVRDAFEAHAFLARHDGGSGHRSGQVADKSVWETLGSSFRDSECPSDGTVSQARRPAASDYNEPRNWSEFESLIDEEMRALIAPSIQFASRFVELMPLRNIKGRLVRRFERHVNWRRSVVFSASLPWSIADNVPLIRPPDALNYSHTIPSCSHRYFSCSHPCDEQPQQEVSNDQELSPLQDGVRGRNQHGWLLDDLARGLGCNRIYQPFFHHSKTHAPRQNDARESELVFQTYAAISEQSGMQPEATRRSSASSFADLDTCVEVDLGQSASVFEPLNHPSCFDVGDCESDYITAIEFQRQDDIYDITVDDFNNYWTGVFNANSGKSLCIAMEFASRILGSPIIAADGSIIPLKWPPSDLEHCRLYWIIGWDINHSATIYKLLFERGMGGTLRVIKDELTGKWRIYNRNDPRDTNRYRSSKLAEPIIPERFIDMASWSWEEKKANQFKSVRLKNGAWIHCYPSSGRNPKQGEAVSGIWIDEDIQYGLHLKEWQDRLTDEAGWFMWSVWPHIKNDALMNLLDRAEATVEDPERQIESFQLIMTDNPFLTEKGKRESLNMMESEEEIGRRNRGDLQLDRISMYDFYPHQHLIKRQDGKATREHPTITLLRKIWSESNTFPRDWTRYLAIDPSHTRTGVQSWVVPPPEWEQVGNLAICEWEFMPQKYTADMLARELSKMMQGCQYEAFIMDKHAGKQTHAGRDNTTFEVYSQAFASHRLFSRLTNNSFSPGVDVISTRTKAVRDFLALSENGIPGFLFVEERCPETRREFNSYRKKVGVVGGVETILDEPANPRLFDAMVTMEYFAAYIVPQFAMGTAYISPSEWQPKGSPAYQKAMAILNKQNRSDEQYVHLGPGAVA